jgi:hypothetical protein
MTQTDEYVWVVHIYWGPGSMDPMSLIESVWTDEAQARAHAATQGSSASVERMRINVPAGYD